LFQILDSKNIRIDGIKLNNSPFWTLHPINCTNLILKDLIIRNPVDSPNTDGIDIESSVNVEVKGCDINVGDDGIAVKCGSGKDMMQFQRSENISASDCIVRNAHGGFVIGSETASGVKGAYVRNCKFLGTDRGIRIKTRRGRGGCMTDIVASDIYMKDVICPVAISMYYRCGTEEEAPFTLEKLPVAEDTPSIKNVLLENLTAEGCKNSAAFIAGLPEAPIENVVFKNCTFTVTDKLAENTEAEMCKGIPVSSYRGIRVINAEAKFEKVSVNVEPAVQVEKY
jgi:polygalacturonase